MVRKTIPVSIERDVGVSNLFLRMLRVNQIEQWGKRFGELFGRTMPLSKDAVSEDRSEMKALTILLAIALMNVVEGSEKDELSVYMRVLLADSNFTDQKKDDKQCHSWQCFAVMLFGISLDEVSRVNYNCDGSICSIVDHFILDRLLTSSSLCCISSLCFAAG